MGRRGRGRVPGGVRFDDLDVASGARRGFGGLRSDAELEVVGADELLGAEHVPVAGRARVEAPARRAARRLRQRRRALHESVVNVREFTRRAVFVEHV